MIPVLFLTMDSAHSSMMMVENLVKSQGLENVTEDHLQGIKEIMDGEHDIAFHMTGFSNLYYYLK